MSSPSEQAGRAGAPSVESDVSRYPMARPAQTLLARPLLADAVLALALDVVTIVPLLLGGENRWWVWVLDQALVAPLVLRRRHPAAVFTVLAALALAQWLADVPLAADATLLVALFTVSAQQSRLRALLAAGVLEVGVVLASLRFAPATAGLAASLVFLSGLVVAALLGGIALTTHTAYLASMVERTRALERDRDQRARLAVASERARIAREMHDVVSHGLSVVIALADGASLSTRSSPDEAAAAMSLVSATGREALSDMRRMLGVLREDATSGPSLAPTPGIDQLPELLERVRGTGLDVELAVLGRPVAVPATTATSAYRIVQESLTNVLKHAVGCSVVTVTIRWEAQRLALEVVDDGRPGAALTTSGPGQGVAGMGERAAAVSGSMTAGPAPGGGWRVCAVLPLVATLPAAGVPTH